MEAEKGPCNMVRDTSLSAALDAIASSSIKDRQEGLELLTEILSKPSNCEQLQNNKEGLGWLQVFQTLFGLVKMERASALRKTKTTGV